MKSRLATATIIIPLVLLVSSFSPDEKEALYRIKTIVIDAGHGGKDPGCLGSKSHEKNVALAIALKTGAYIEKYFPNINVIYTRKKDVFVELHERAAIANRNKADLFMSIHCNASGSSKVFGTETYVMGLHKANQNLTVSKRENSVILLEEDHLEHYDGFDPNSPESHIIFSLYQNADLDQSIYFASKIQQQFKERVNRKDRGVKQAGFLVLYRTTMPSVLIETGYLTSREEENYLITAINQDYIALAIYRAFKDYKKAMEETGGGKKTKLEDYQIATSKKMSDVQAELAEKKKNEASENNTFNSGEKVEIKEDAKIEEDKAKITFRVQLGIFKKKLTKDHPDIKGRYPVSNEKIGNDYKYVVGDCSNLKCAHELQTKFREKGYKDAFVVAYEGAVRIRVEDAIIKSYKKP